jgi:gamma-glutamyltranspeptidase/glutathione hydrolase
MGSLVWHEPLRADWHGYEILSAPPPSSGGFGVVQLLKMKEYLADEFDGVAHNSTRYIHLIAVNPGLESGDTTHFSVFDQWGNAVSNTYTLNWNFGGRVVGSTANEIQPGKRMLSSMSPTILLKDGDVALVIGTPGVPTIFTSVFQTIVNIYEFGMSPLEAVGATSSLISSRLVMFRSSITMARPIRPLQNARLTLTIGTTHYPRFCRFSRRL